MSLGWPLSQLRSSTALLAASPDWTRTMACWMVMFSDGCVRSDSASSANASAGLPSLFSTAAIHCVAREGGSLALTSCRASAAALARQLVNANDPPSLATQWMAAVLNKDGKPAEALALLAESERTHPSENITIQHAMVLVQSGDAAKSAVLLRSWLNGHPNDMAALHALADVTLNAGDYAGAQDALERILAKTPDDVIVLNNLAWIYQRSGDQRAHEVAERAYHLSPLSPAVADTYGWVLLSEGDVQQALPHLRMASYGMPDNPSVQYHLAAALSRAGNGAGAKQILQKVVVNDAKFDGKQQASELYRSLGGRVN